MIRNLLFFLTILIAFGCKNDMQTSRYYDDGRAKPVVYIPTIIDSSSFDFPWSLSEEFTSIITQKVIHKGTLHIPTEPQGTFSIQDNPFGSDLSWVKKIYDPCQFVVFIELFEHDEVPIKDTENTLGNYASNVNMGARIRIVDIRGTHPKIVLQEAFEDSYYISKNLLKTNYNITIWGTDEYKSSPLSMAHNQFAKTITERINDYIMLAKNR